MMKKPAKVSKVMREFKAGSLKSSSGQKVTNPKQAIAIGLSEAGMSKPKKESPMKYAKGGDMKKVFAGKETKAEEAKERKMAGSKAAYKKAEMKYEGEKYARGGGVESKGKTKGTMVKMAKGGMTKKGKRSC